MAGAQLPPADTYGTLLCSVQVHTSRKLLLEMLGWQRRIALRHSGQKIIGVGRLSITNYKSKMEHYGGKQKPSSSAELVAGWKIYSCVNAKTAGVLTKGLVMLTDHAVSETSSVPGIYSEYEDYNKYISMAHNPKSRLRPILTGKSMCVCMYVCTYIRGTSSALPLRPSCGSFTKWYPLNTTKVSEHQPPGNLRNQSSLSNIGEPQRASSLILRSAQQHLDFSPEIPRSKHGTCCRLMPPVSTRVTHHRTSPPPAARSQIGLTHLTSLANSNANPHHSATSSRGLPGPVSRQKRAGTTSSSVTPVPGLTAPSSRANSRVSRILLVLASCTGTCQSADGGSRLGMTLTRPPT